MFHRAGHGARARIPGLVLIAILSGPLRAAPADPSGDRFRFNPPDGAVSYHAERTTTVTLSDDEIVKIEDNTSIFRSETRRTPSGFAITWSEKATADGDPQDVDDPAFNTFDISITDLIDREGRMTEVRGLEGVVERTRSALPAGTAQTWNDTVGLEGLRRESFASWTIGAATWLGRRIRPGETWTFDGPAAVPRFGLAPHHVRVTVVDLRELNGRRVADLYMAFYADPGKLLAIVRRMRAIVDRGSEERTQTPLRAHRFLSAHCSGTLDLVVDTRTGESVSAARSRTLDYIVQYAGREPRVVEVNVEFRSDPIASPPSGAATAARGAEVVGAGAAGLPRSLATLARSASIW